MRTLDELLERESPAWTDVKGWISSATNDVELLPRDTAAAEATLLALQVTTRSPLGAMAYEAGGLLVLGQWVRVLGSGAQRLSGSLHSWNFDAEGHPRREGLLTVAHDALGGVFALDGGALGPGRGGAYYFAPDSLQWEDLERGYSGLLRFFLGGDLAGFYGDYLHGPWVEAARSMPSDTGLSLVPPLWTREGKAFAQVSARPVPMRELVAMHFDLAKQLDGGA